MAQFPSLNTGAVAQYPLTANTGQGAQVIRFIDGTDQRYQSQARMLRSWRIRLDLLNEDETSQLETFFIAQQGDYSTFVFPDPISGTPIPNCRFASAGLATEYAGIDAASIDFWVIETNG